MARKTITVQSGTYERLDEFRKPGQSWDGLLSELAEEHESNTNEHTLNTDELKREHAKLEEQIEKLPERIAEHIPGANR